MAELVCSIYGTLKSGQPELAALLAQVNPQALPGHEAREDIIESIPRL
jgi:hypothetical protein